MQHSVLNLQLCPRAADGVARARLGDRHGALSDSLRLHHTSEELDS